MDCVSSNVLPSRSSSFHIITKSPVKDRNIEGWQCMIRTWLWLVLVFSNTYYKLKMLHVTCLFQFVPGLTEVLRSAGLPSRTVTTFATILFPKFFPPTTLNPTYPPAGRIVVAICLRLQKGPADNWFGETIWSHFASCKLREWEIFLLQWTT